MKTAVYAICKDEEQFVRRWLDSKGEADVICLLDTGSTDGTLEAAQAWAGEHPGRTLMLKRTAYEHWQTVEEYDAIKARGGRPWRFDTARNESLDMVPAWADICVCTDLDEVFLPGWREKLEKAWGPEVTTARYEYVWNFRPDGTDGVKFYGEKIHRNGVCRWAGPVHEVPAYSCPRRDVTVNIRLEHHADDTKSRGSYLPMLELAVREDRSNDRNVHYLGREYVFRGMYGKAVETLKRHLALPSATWPEERAASMRYIARSLEAKGDPDGAELWLRRAADEAPDRREPLTELARLCLARNDWHGTVRWCERALSVTGRPMTYMADPYAWNEGPWDLMSVARWYLGEREYARNCASQAAVLAPGDERIRRNLEQMEATNYKNRLETETDQP